MDHSAKTRTGREQCGVHIVAIDVDGVSMAVGCGRFRLRRSDGAAVGVVDDL